MYSKWGNRRCRFVLPRCLGEVLVSTRILSHSQVELLQLSVQGILAAIDPNSWCPLLITVIVTNIMLKMQMNKIAAKLVGGLCGLSYTLYRDSKSGFNDISFALCSTSLNSQPIMLLSMHRKT